MILWFCSAFLSIYRVSFDTLAGTQWRLKTGVPRPPCGSNPGERAATAVQPPLVAEGWGHLVGCDVFTDCLSTF